MTERTWTDRGILDPIDLIDPADCIRVIADGAAAIPGASWYKGLHEVASRCSEVAADPRIGATLEPILGPDILLWSTQLMKKRDGRNHRWHADVEAIEWPTVNGWLALRNVGPKAHLIVIPGSQHWPVKPQDLIADGLDLDDTEAVLRAARAIDPAAELVRLAIRPGQLLLFDGRIWHGSENTSGKTRYALLMQYSPASVEVRIPTTYSRPTVWSEQRPLCLSLTGNGDGPNQLLDDRRRLHRFTPHRLHPTTLKMRYI